MKVFKKIVALLCASVTALSLVACGGGTGITRAELKYPDRPNADPTKDSWTQWTDDDKVSVSWYVDLAGWNNNTSALISKEIYARTGVNVVFETPANSDGTKLSTMMQTNNFTDVISIAANQQERIKLAEAGNYIFPIQELAKRWAPTLLNRLNQEMVTMYTASDGNLYGIPNHFYSTEDVNEYKEMEANA